MPNRLVLTALLLLLGLASPLPAGAQPSGDFHGPPPPAWLLAREGWIELYLEPRTPLPVPPESLPALVAEVGQMAAHRLGVEEPPLTQVVLQRAPGPPAGPWGPCPARGLAAASADPPLVKVFVHAQDARPWLEAALAHELGHVLAREVLGEGRSLMLNEGLATWTAHRAWAAWQEWASLHDGVRLLRREGRYVPLGRARQALQEVQASTQACFEQRDAVYSEWASFVDFLLQDEGWQPFRRVWTAGAFRTVYGRSLTDLEASWLDWLQAPQEDLRRRWGDLAGRLQALRAQEAELGQARLSARWDRLAGHLLDRTAGILEEARLALEEGAYDRAARHLDAAQAHLDSAENALGLARDALRAEQRSRWLRVALVSLGAALLAAAAWLRRIASRSQSW